MSNDNKGISAFPNGDDMFTWIGTIEGSKDTVCLSINFILKQIFIFFSFLYQVYEGLSYKLSLTFPNGYPFIAPTVKFITPCFHPNVDTHGNICLDILKDKWSALLDVRTILLSIQSLLGDPNNDSPLNGQAAQTWSDQVAYKKILHQKYNESKP